MSVVSRSSKKVSIRNVAETQAPGEEGTLTEPQIRAMPDSSYMNASQLEFFRRRLLEMRGEVLVRQESILEQLISHETAADPADQATAVEEYTLALRLRERESMLVRKIDESLARIRSKEYGYCEKTGEPIGILRLLARPTASVCIQVKDHNEKAEVHFRSR